MKNTFYTTRLGAVVVVAAFAVIQLLGCSAGSDSSSSDLTDNTADLGLHRQAGAQSAELLSAFFGLDNRLPFGANVICRGAAGKDGMPVIFSTEIDQTSMQAGDFRVTKRSGLIGTVHCVTLRPATDSGELRTVLLIGEFGDAADDPPTNVEIVGHLHSIDGTLDFKGATIGVTPLKPGPSLVMAEVVADLNDVGVRPGRRAGTPCPSEGVLQAIRVVWAGGITLADGGEPGEVERVLYKISVESDDGVLHEVEPIAVADLGDGDNNHVLCLGTSDRPISVSFPSGVFTDPNDDLNPATTVEVNS